MLQHRVKLLPVWPPLPSSLKYSPFLLLYTSPFGRPCILEMLA